MTNENILVVTTNDIPGYTIKYVYGESFGLIVRNRNIIANTVAGIKSIFGGELKGITKLLHDSRDAAINRLKEDAKQKGANAILAMHFETNEYKGTGVEVCAYGTAVFIEKN